MKTFTPIPNVASPSATSLLHRLPYGKQIAQFVQRNPKQWGLALFLISAIGSPLVKFGLFVKAFKGANLSDSEERLLFTQEAVRQVVGTALWVGSALASWALSKRYLGKNVDSIVHFFTSSSASTAVDTFLRPPLTAFFTTKLVPNNNTTTSTYRKQQPLRDTNTTPQQTTPSHMIVRSMPPSPSVQPINYRSYQPYNYPAPTRPMPNYYQHPFTSLTLY